MKKINNFFRKIFKSSQSEESKTSKQEKQQKSQKFESCQICLNQYSEKNVCCQTCFLCSSCLDQWFSQQIKDQIGDPQSNLSNVKVSCPSCRKDISIELLKKFQKMFSNSIDTLTQFSLKKDDSYIVCPSANCKNIGWISDKQCRTDFSCTACNYQWQNPNRISFKKMIVQIFSKDFKSRLFKFLFTKNCPYCNTCIQKNGGCKHMTCGKLISQQNDKAWSINQEVAFNSFDEINSNLQELDFSSQTLFFVMRIKKFKISDAINLTTLILQYKNLHTLALDFRNTNCLLESILVFGEQLKYSCINTIILDIRQLDIMDEQINKLQQNQSNKPTNIINMKLNIRKDNHVVSVKELQRYFTFMNRQNKIKNKNLFELIAENLANIQGLKQIGLYFNQFQVSEDNSEFVCEQLLKCKNLQTLTINIYNPFMFNEDFIRLGDILSSSINIVTQISLFLYIISIDQQSANHLGNSFQCCKTLESLSIIAMANQITKIKHFILLKIYKIVKN
ncbi:hypothetical protein ABPG72_019901 [Tetrahymena utriculariae]